jgi:hypothetical protein
MGGERGGKRPVPPAFGAAQAMGLGMMMMMPATMALQARMLGIGIGAGLAAGRMMQAYGLRGTAEALEQVEDLVCDVRSDLGAALALGQAAGGAADAGRADPGDIVVIEGHVVGASDLPAVPGVAASAASSGHGRLRLVIAQSGGNGGAEARRAALALLADRLSGFPEVSRVTVRALTGSLIVEGETSAEALCANLQRAGVVRLVPSDRAGLMALGLRRTIDTLDARLRVRSGGALDLRGTLALIVLAWIVIRRGREAVPEAAALLEARLTAVLDTAGRRRGA